MEDGVDLDWATAEAMAMGSLLHQGVYSYGKIVGPILELIQIFIFYSSCALCLKQIMWGRHWLSMHFLISQPSDSYSILYTVFMHIYFFGRYFVTNGGTLT